MPGVALVASLARTRWHIVYRAVGTEAAHSRLLSNYANARSFSRSSALSLSLSFSPCLNVGRVYVPINVSDLSGEKEKRKGREKRDERPLDERATNARRE